MRLWSVEHFSGEASHYSEVIQAVTGDYYMAGWAPDLCLFKADQTGELLWSYGLEGWDWQGTYWVEELEDGTIVVTGACGNESDSYYSLLVAKVQPDGSEVWAHVYDLNPDRSECGYSITELPDGDLIVCGFNDSVGFPSISYAYVMRIDPEGNMLWDAEWGKSTATNFSLRATYSEGVFYILAHGTDVGTGAPHILWYSESGVYLGRQRIEVLASYYTGQGHPNEDSGFTFTSNSGMSGDPPSYTSLTRVDSLGNVIWLTRVAPNNLTRGISVTRMSSGDYLYGGWVYTSLVEPFTKRGVLYSFDSEGNEIWNIELGDFGCERFDGVIETTSGDIIACGGYQESWLYCFGDATGIEVDPDIQQQIVLYSIPNPFSSSMSITCTLPNQVDDTELSVYCISGRRIRVLHSGHLDSGDHVFDWTPESDTPSGFYLIRLRAGNDVLTETCIYMR